VNLDPARATWRKSRASSSNNACVEVAVTPDAIGIRDTKDRTAGHLVLAPGSWAAFLEKASHHWKSNDRGPRRLVNAGAPCCRCL
jgi:Domain of unknown function (DUF397)